MSKPLFLSYSQISTFKDCSEKFRLERIERLRPTTTSSAFFFGSAIDSAVEAMLVNFKSDDIHGKGCDAFKKAMELTNVDINKKKYNGNDALLKINFSSGDIQLDLIHDISIVEFASNLGIEINNKYTIDNFLEYYKAKKTPDEDETLLYNFIAYSCLISKGGLFILELCNWIKKNVAEVHYIQKKILLKNNKGDSFIGFLDFVVTLKDGRKFLIDLKTTSSMSYYQEGCVEQSPQLAIYSEDLGIRNAAYLVIEKNIRKRKPRVRLHFIEGVITEDQLDKVFKEIAEATVDIKKGKFKKNKDACFKFGKCPYYDLCHFGKKKGLEVVK